MSKTSIVYIGPKAKKKDTVTGSRLVFPRLKPVDVESDIAEQLLDYTDVWVLEADVKEVVKKQKAKEKAIADELAKQKEAQEAANLKESFVVMLNDEELDIGKYSSKQLETLAEGEDLVITTNKKPVEPYRLAIRDALREKNGATESKDTE